MQVVSYRGKFLLKNGYHRAVGLLMKGLSHAPCVIVEVGDFGETAAAGVGFFNETLLMRPRPPLVGDFLDTELTLEVAKRPIRKIIRVRPDEFIIQDA